MHQCLPRTVLGDVTNAFFALAKGVGCSFLELAHRKLENGDYRGFGRVWHLPHRLHVGLRYGRVQFCRAWPYTSTLDVKAEVVTHESRLARATRDWRLSKREQNILDLVVRGFTNAEVADRLRVNGGEDAAARALSRIFELAHIPRERGNRRIGLVLKFMEPMAHPPIE